MAVKSLGAMSERIEMLVQQITCDEHYFLEFVSDVETMGLRAACYCMYEDVSRRSGLSMESCRKLPSMIKLMDIVTEMERRYVKK